MLTMIVAPSSMLPMVRTIGPTTLDRPTPSWIVRTDSPSIRGGPLGALSKRRTSLSLQYVSNGLHVRKRLGDVIYLQLKKCGIACVMCVMLYQVHPQHFFSWPSIILRHLLLTRLTPFPRISMSPKILSTPCPVPVSKHLYPELLSSSSDSNLFIYPSAGTFFQGWLRIFLLARCAIGASIAQSCNAQITTLGLSKQYQYRHSQG